MDNNFSTNDRLFNADDPCNQRSEEVMEKKLSNMSQSIKDPDEAIEQQLDATKMLLKESLEENAKLKGTITRLRSENLESYEHIKEQLGLASIKFNRGAKDEEGNFDVSFKQTYENIQPPLPSLKAKDLLSFPVFMKKIMGLTGKILPDVDQTAWKLFLQDNIMGVNSLI